MTLEFLQFFSYILYTVSLTGYVVLDGFDLGVGSIYLLIKGDTNRRILLNAIGPVWDGNAVWLVVTLGVLLAAFPPVFSSMLSGLYLPSMTIVFGFMLRAASIEFRSKSSNRLWKKFFDLSFGFGSLITILTLGLLVGSLLKGVPLDSMGELIRPSFRLIDLYTVLCAFLTLTLFSLHGTLFLLIKCEGTLKKRIQKFSSYLIILLSILWITVSLYTYLSNKTIIQYVDLHPIVLTMSPTILILQAALFYANWKEEDYTAFILSSFSIVLMITLYAFTVYPHLIFSSIHPMKNSLTIFNSSASYLSLLVIFIVGITGVPLSFFYFRYLYKIFSGKVIIDKTSY